MNTIQNVLVTGGAGYVGSRLVPKLLDAGYGVTVYDWMVFGDHGLPRHPRLKVVKGDIRDTKAFFEATKGNEAVIHLACISNDPSFELDPNLSKSVNYDCFEPMVKAAKEAGVSRFIYASTSSVYGVSDAPEVTEDHPLVPLTDYNKYKGLCEPILNSIASPDFTVVTIRPATVCGPSPRMRFDLSVNILTNLAVNKGVITVFGGTQKRPNINIDDMTDLYLMLLKLPKEKIHKKIYNAGYQNYTIAELADMVKKVVAQEFPDRPPIEIQTSPTDDLRSYHVSSKKIGEELGFVPKRTVEDAIRDVCNAFKTGQFPNSLTDQRYFNVKQMKETKTV